MTKKRSVATQSNLDTKEKTYKKLINFYKIAIDPSFIDTRKTSSEVLKEYIFKAFKNQTFNLEDVMIEKIELDDNYFFGSICRRSDLDILTEVKSVYDEKSIKNADIIIESYTYFLIDLNNLSMSVIKTQKIPRSDEYIKDLILKISPLNVVIAPFLKKEEEIKSMLANSFSLTFYDNSDKYIGLKQSSLFDCEFGELTIKAKLKNKNKNIMRNLINTFKGNSDIKSLSASTDSEDIDLLKSSFTKHVTIELSKDYKNDLDRIRRTLAKELSVIETQSI